MRNLLFGGTDADPIDLGVFNILRSYDHGVPSLNEVRVAYGLTEAQGASKLAFTVDASSLGKSKVIALYAKAPLFATMREISEPAADYAQALADLVASGTTTVTSMPSRLYSSL